ncbi:MAG: ATP synthase F0 subunit B [Legionellales bacterium]|nr:ATP synthase F0 subunit B [Legionellales bacterium]|tara:strand:+ start:1075 stop:1563 length:489 start_codon:yes stop_codon:yes gene_type:complete
MNINATLFVESVIFAIFVALTMRYIWPHILASLQEREADIRQGIEQSRQAELALSQANEQADEIIRDAQGKREGILKEARSEASLVIEEARRHTVSERNRLIQEAHSQIDTYTSEVKEGLVDQQLSHVQMLCRQLIGERYDPKILTQDVLDGFLANSKEDEQ